jgi:hypothetical protein
VQMVQFVEKRRSMGNKFLHKNRVQKKNQYQENLKNLLVPVSFLRDPTERGTSGRNYLRSETGTISRCGWFMGSGVCFMSEVGLF